MPGFLHQINFIRGRRVVFGTLKLRAARPSQSTLWGFYPPSGNSVPMFEPMHSGQQPLFHHMASMHLHTKPILYRGIIHGRGSDGQRPNLHTWTRPQGRILCEDPLSANEECVRSWPHSSPDGHPDAAAGTPSSRTRSREAEQGKHCSSFRATQAPECAVWRWPCSKGQPRKQPCITCMPSRV